MLYNKSETETPVYYLRRFCMKKQDLQKKLDIEKWLESEVKGRDMCGAYDFCAYCENETELPCASAYERLQNTSVKPAAKKKSAPKTTAKKPAAKTDAAKATKPAKKPAAKKAEKTI